MKTLNNNEYIDSQIIKYDSAQNTFVEDHKFTSIECCLDIYLNGELLATSLCSPNNHCDLVTGILAQMGKIRTIDEIISLEIDEDNCIAKVTTTDEAVKFFKNISQNPRYFSAKQILDCNFDSIVERPNDVKFRAKDILNCADKLLSELAINHNKTNGVHSGVIFDGQNILVFREDIGRHNVFDKLYGWALRNKIDLTEKIIIFSGRCSSEMMLKLWRMGIYAVAAKSVPTTLSIALAKKLGITLVARMRQGSFCIYANSERIVLDIT